MGLARDQERFANKSVKHFEYFKDLKAFNPPNSSKITLFLSRVLHTKQSTMPFTTTTKSSTKTFDDASSTYSAASTSTIVKEKEEAKRKWLFKNKSKASTSADSKNKDAALHYEAMAHYFAFR
ncbi:hypothetical protein BDW74DRAFT_178193 [Aspergillus multicolor]|uniref:uncharacterized protein n=1 Tax=Aspergillus multicolor TaxID=41759 RepID=UPI003CCDCB7B